MSLFLGDPCGASSRTLCWAWRPSPRGKRSSPYAVKPHHLLPLRLRPPRMRAGWARPHDRFRQGRLPLPRRRLPRPRRGRLPLPRRRLHHRHRRHHRHCRHCRHRRHCPRRLLNRIPWCLRGRIRPFNSGFPPWAPMLCKRLPEIILHSRLSRRSSQHWCRTPAAAFQGGGGARAGNRHHRWTSGSPRAKPT